MMSKKWMGMTVVSLCLAAAVSVSSSEEETMTIRPIEIYACSYNEGQGMEDLMRVTAQWNAWMDKEGQQDYWAYTMLPVFHSDEIDFDVAWVGGWKDGATMAAGTRFWIEQGGELQVEFAKVVDCDMHANYAVLDIKPSPSPYQAGPIEFSNCTVKDGRTVEEAIGAIHQWVAYLGEQGIEAGQYLLFPAYGESSEASYSFKWVSVSSYATFGRSYDQYGTGGGWRKAEDLFGRLLDCDSPRVYHGTPVRKADAEN